MSKLLVIESPNKIKTLKKYLGNDFKIIATVGHIRDLSHEGLGFDDDFNINWTVMENKNGNANWTSKKEIISNLKKQAGDADEIYIATDPDREGEAIAWHVYEVLNKSDKPKCKRITFNEITEHAVKESFNHKRKIDINWVESQFARRIIDRLIGFKLSDLLRKKIKATSAGRVQSVALKFVDDREKEIDNFVSENWYSIETILVDDNVLVLKKINPKLGIKTSEKSYSANVDFDSEIEAKKLIDSLNKSFKIVKIEEPTIVNVNPKPAYKTSTLQQDAINKLNWDTKKITMIAQHLYEGIEMNNSHVALISYPRTDSTRLSDEFLKPAYAYVEKTYGKEYVGKYVTKNKSENVQDAHEAIRPTNLDLTPESIKNQIGSDELKLYTLIYNRTIASIMSSAQYKKVSIIFDNNGNEFHATSKECIFLGYKKLDTDEIEESNEKLIDLSNYAVNKEIEGKSVTSKLHTTTPPAKYTQATLIADLEKAGVGRPSTYTSMSNVILEREYAHLDKKSYVMNQMGKDVIEQLIKYFPNVINKGFTKEMEDHLDEIANGKENWKSYLKGFVPDFNKDVEKANMEMVKSSDELVGKKCPECNSELVYKVSKNFNKKFVGCSNYPNCKYIEKESNGIATGKKCPECSKDLLIKTSKNNNQFVACSGFPACKYIENNNNLNVEKVGRECSKCHKDLVFKTAKSSGKKFIGCSGYPNCDYVEWINDNSSNKKGKK